jgi:ABC-type cobalamin transport system permease subunit
VLPALLAVRSSASAIGAGPWDLMLMVVDGQLSAPVMLAGCVVAGSLVGTLVLLRDSREFRTNNRTPLGSRPQAG